MNLATIRYFRCAHTTNARSHQISDHWLRNSKQKSEMPDLRKRGIMCATEKKIHMHTTYFQIRSSERRSVVEPITYERLWSKRKKGNNERKLVVYFDSYK